VRIDRESAKRKAERKADRAAAPPPTDAGGQKKRRTQVAELAAALLADQILDGDVGGGLDDAARDSLRVAQQALDAVWRVLDEEEG
jgi:hypothetical protein